MNNAIDLALTTITNEIPPDVLAYAFSTREEEEKTWSVQQMVLDKVIQDRVLKDMNVHGGKLKHIVLLPKYREKLRMDVQDAYMHTGPFSLYRIPPEEREGLPLVEVHGLTYRGNYAGYVPNMNGWAGGVNLNTLGQAVLDSHTFASSPPKPNVELLSGDLVKLWPAQHSIIVWVMSCRIAYDKDFTNLNTSALETFEELCLEATKAYIYNQTIIALDRGYVESGYEIGEMKRTIDTYADSRQRYRELREQMVGAMGLDMPKMFELLPFLI